MSYPYIPFYTLTAVAVLIFAWAAAARVRPWLSARASAYMPPFARQGSLARRGLWRRLLTDVALQLQVLRQSRLRWAAHMCIMWGFAELFFIGSLTNFFMERGWVSVTKDTAWFAALNESAGLLLLLGVALAFYRRYWQRPRHLRSGMEDTAVLTLLALLVLTGYLVEAARFLATGGATAIGYSYVGYALYLAGSGVDSGWLVAYKAVWWLHAAMGLSLVAYVAFSKLFHMLSSPLLIAVRQETAPRVAGAEAAVASSLSRDGVSRQTEA